MSDCSVLVEHRPSTGDKISDRCGWKWYSTCSKSPKWDIYQLRPKWAALSYPRDLHGFSSWKWSTFMLGLPIFQTFLYVYRRVTNYDTITCGLQQHKLQGVQPPKNCLGFLTHFSSKDKGDGPCSIAACRWASEPTVQQHRSTAMETYHS